MFVQDPFTHTTVPLDELKTLPPVGQYVPAIGKGGQWFAVYAPTCRAYKLDEVADDVAATIRAHVAADDLAQDLLNRCNEAVLKGAKANAEGRAKARGVAADAHGVATVAIAEGRCRAAGFTADQIAAAWAVRQPQTLEEVVEDKETTVVKASALPKPAAKNTAPRK